MSRFSRLAADELTEILQRIDAEEASRTDVKIAVKHFLAVLAERAPGRSVEVRIPPFGAIQCIPGVEHRRGTPPAVVETDARVWIDLARGNIAWQDAAVRATGERSDLTEWLPLI